MGNPNSKNSIQKNQSAGNTHNFVNSSGEFSKEGNNKSNIKQADVFTKFTWNYGGNQVLLTGSFNRWKQTIPLERQGDQFSITIPLPRGLHQYKFIVDGEWRFSPEDPSTPDANGNINNYIDTTNFHPTIQPVRRDNNRDQNTDRQAHFQGVDEFSKTAPKLPPHYQRCSYLKSNYHPNMSFPNGGYHNSPIIDQNTKFEQTLTEAEVMQLFNSAHCLPPPYHVEVDHLIKQAANGYTSLCITQRFKSKYTTYRYFILQSN